MRTHVIFGGLALVLSSTLALVVQKERVLTTGQLVLLELAPVDPRSLMQGDYMRLDYAITRERGWVDIRAPDTSPSRDGNLVLKLDEHGVGHFVRIDSPDTPLAPGEFKLRYRLRGGWARLGAESFFFQEGHGHRFARARYAELRVAPSGASVLAGLRDANRAPIPAGGDDLPAPPAPGDLDLAPEPTAPLDPAPTVAPDTTVTPPAPPDLRGDAIAPTEAAPTSDDAPSPTEAAPTRPPSTRDDPTPAP